MLASRAGSTGPLDGLARSKWSDSLPRGKRSRSITFSEPSSGVATAPRRFSPIPLTSIRSLTESNGRAAMIRSCQDRADPGQGLEFLEGRGVEVDLRGWRLPSMEEQVPAPDLPEWSRPLAPSWNRPVFAVALDPDPAVAIGPLSVVSPDAQHARVSAWGCPNSLPGPTGDREPGPDQAQPGGVGPVAGSRGGPA